jgi:hypothetical protein
MFIQRHDLFPAITGTADDSWGGGITERVVEPFQGREMGGGGESGTVSSAAASQDQVLAARFIEESSEHSALEPWGNEGTLSPLHLRIFSAGRNSWVDVVGILII